jgi:hypothetical protein
MVTLALLWVFALSYNVSAQAQSPGGVPDLPEELIPTSFDVKIQHGIDASGMGEFFYLSINPAGPMVMADLQSLTDGRFAEYEVEAEGNVSVRFEELINANAVIALFSDYLQNLNTSRLQSVGATYTINGGADIIENPYFVEPDIYIIDEEGNRSLNPNFILTDDQFLNSEFVTHTAGSTNGSDVGISVYPEDEPARTGVTGVDGTIE